MKTIATGTAALIILVVFLSGVIFVGFKYIQNQNMINNTIIREYTIAPTDTGADETTEEEEPLMVCTEYSISMVKGIRDGMDIMPEFPDGVIQITQGPATWYPGSFDWFDNIIDWGGVAFQPETGTTYTLNYYKCSEVAG